MSSLSPVARPDLPGFEAAALSESPGVHAGVAAAVDAEVAVAALDDTRVAQWLGENPSFFDEHADLLGEVKIRHPHGGRAISLVERQVLVLREKNKALEMRMAELIRIGQENDHIVGRLQRLTRDLLSESDPARLPTLLSDGLTEGFSVPQVAIRLWDVAGAVAPFDGPVSADLRRRTHEMRQPYCGPNAQAEAAGWLGSPQTGPDQVASEQAIESIALLALQAGTPAETFGLLVMGSPDPGRFQAGMGTAFLEQLAQIASASLSRLRR